MRFSFFVAALCCVLNATAHEVRPGYTDIMPPEQAAFFRGLLPKVDAIELQRILNDLNTMWYDSESIYPSYQDSQGDPEGNRPNSIEPAIIDPAVPGGWSFLFQSRGKFQFPFASGGADLCDNLVKINFWSVPRSGAEFLPVVYWKMDFSRWRWLFPVGTSIGEVLMVKFPDGALRVFEIRVRKRIESGWDNKIYRPFLTARDLADAIKIKRPNWIHTESLVQLVQHLEDTSTLTPRTLEAKSFKKAFEPVTGALDILPEFGDMALVKQLLTETVFKDVQDSAWKSNSVYTTYAASTKASYSIVPRNYDAGVLPVDNESCTRCHDNAGRQIRDFKFELVLYGEIWGEDQIFSWHPFENEAFVKPNGNVNHLNSDNRKIRTDFLSSGLFVPYKPGMHPNHLYKEISHDWVYNPVH